MQIDKLKRKVLVRADGDSEIGLGHLMRCLSLVQMLNENFSATFYCHSIPKSLKKDFTYKGYSVISVLNEDEFIANVRKDDIVVLDGYNFSTDLQMKIKNANATLVCIDDLHQINFYADVIINPSPGISRNDYNAQSYTRFALGLKYVLLRPAFIQRAQEQRTPVPISTLLICFGGADPQNLTCFILENILESKEFRRIVLITGAAFSKNEALNRLIKKDTRIEIIQNASESEIFNAMTDSQLAIVPASTVLYEIFSVKMQVISGFSVNNQKYLYDQLMNLGVIYGVNDFKDISLIKDQIKFAFTDSSKEIFEKQHELIDGCSKQNIITLFNQLN